jgi:hypothetical protein
MKRTWIGVLTGLALLAQTSAMAWSASHFAAPEPAATAEAAMPCHGDALADAGKSGAQPCGCCAGGCIFACGGAPLPAFALVVPAATPDHLFPAAAIPAPLASHTLSPFRPPAV